MGTKKRERTGWCGVEWGQRGGWSSIERLFFLNTLSVVYIMQWLKILMNPVIDITWLCFQCLLNILASEISGKTLSLVDRQCLKDIGIESIGKQLAVLACIKELLCKYFSSFFFFVILLSCYRQQPLSVIFVRVKKKCQGCACEFSGSLLNFIRLTLFILITHAVAMVRFSHLKG